MDIEELKRETKVKVLLRGESGSGKTLTTSKIVLKLLQHELDVLYADTESEGPSTLLNIIEEQGLDEDVVETLSYQQVSNYEEMMEVLENQSLYDVIVMDTLDHKHSYVLKAITDAKTDADADWNEYAQIYAGEKNIMETIGKPEAHIIATLDPDSGKDNKPKGAQTNIHGYFSIVVDIHRSGGEWGNKIVNWVGKSDVIGANASNLVDALSNEVLERTER